ncbi:ORF6N domain-containing protein [Providencia rustigianii]|uniref:ORF6N domain-containing protein n=1 Tax=Providencia rustigianii TaxID=158850 RepID=UPI000F704299|nr:ORF6N domain-containing protein [Providencia rustigianii]MTC60402.1 ORF6N domain-containing protein [Providencia rustigianii]VEH55072.1 Phage anti-repressor protein [Providencia rustigianii]
MTNVSNVSSISNSIKTMPVITHNGVPVVTTETIASLYDTVVGNIKTNFSRNAKRFIEGKHYFKLTGSILKDFKNKVTKSNLVACAKNAKHLTLWTERGAARHAKMLDTDNAWNVFEALEDFYFAKKEEAQQKISLRQSTAKELTPLRQTAERLIATGVANIYPDIWKYVHKEFGVEHINELLPEQIPQAISYLDALEGEYIPRQEPLPLNPINTHILMTNINGAMTHIRAIKDYWNDGLKESLKKLGYDKTGSITEHMIDSLFNLTSASFELTNTDKAKRIK